VFLRKSWGNQFGHSRRDVWDIFGGENNVVVWWKILFRDIWDFVANWERRKLAYKEWEKDGVGSKWDRGTILNTAIVRYSMELIHTRMTRIMGGRLKDRMRR
jgi:hypothetical protein